MLSLCAFALTVHAQKYPPKILGYKVHAAKIVVSTAEPEARSDVDAFVKLGPPRAVSLGLLSSTFEADVEIISYKQDAQIERLMFRDLTVNGVSVDLPEYSKPFRIEKGKTHRFDSPFRVTINTANIARTALKELTDKKDDWQIAGTVLVFGKFKRFGFTFKRVVPVKVSLSIRNPLR